MPGGQSVERSRSDFSVDTVCTVETAPKSPPSPLVTTLVGTATPGSGVSELQAASRKHSASGRQNLDMR
jgi:hypothetical protein